MRTFGLDRCCEELQTVTELARGHHLPFQVSESVADLYQQALRRYGPADGELLGIALLEEQAGLRLRHPPAPHRPPDLSHDRTLHPEGAGPFRAVASDCWTLR
jgi:3-hydroxyisobutyrate dehydrogenase